MEEGKEKLISTIGTAGFHLLIILFLLFYYLKPSIDDRFAEDLGGVPVMFGNVPDAFGDDEPYGRGNGAKTGPDEAVAPNVVPDPIPMAKPTQSAKPVTSKGSNNETATQDLEETIAIKEAKKKAAEEKRRQDAVVAEQRRQQSEKDRIAREEAAKRAQVAQNMGGAFGNGTGSGSRGNTQGTGTQGVPTGNASYGKTSGVGGWGSFDLGGRSVGSGGLVKPTYSVDDYGTVVIDIVVDPKGNVVEATIGRGTNTASATLKNEARKAALRTKFNVINKAGNQSGKITYKFNLN